MIGFAWEQCFDTSVDALAEKSNEFDNPWINQHSTKFVLTVFCASLLVPAWYWYILPFMVAKGWEIGYVFSLRDLEDVVDKLVSKKDEEEEEAREAEEELEKSCSKIIKKADKGKKVDPEKLEKAKHIL